MKELIFVGTERHALHGNGKASNFFGYADAVFEGYGIKVHKYRSPKEFIASSSKHPQGVVVLIYNEEDGIEEASLAEKASYELMDRPLVIHPTSLGRTIGDKAATNALLASYGIRVPRKIHGSTAAKRVFSNDALGSGRSVEAIEPGAALIPDRYNTEFINTAYKYRGKEYYVSLRAMCVGGTCIALYTRCRPVEEGSPSVHAANTPLDADLVNYLHVNIAIRYQKKIMHLCEQIGEIFGLGFYSHDLLPSADDGEVYICESGVKLDELSLLNRLAPIQSKVVMQDLFNGMEVIKTCHEFVRAVNERGYLV